MVTIKKLLGADILTPGIEEMLDAANEAAIVTRVYPPPVMVKSANPEIKKKKKKLMLIRRGLDPNPVFTVGALAEGEDGRWVTINGHHFMIGGADHAIMIGAAAYRTKVAQNVQAVHVFFDDPKVKAFESTIVPLSKEYDGVQVDTVEHAAGVWQSNREASFLIEGKNHGENEVALDAFAAKLGTTAPERQMAMVRFTADDKGMSSAYEFHVPVADEEKAVGVLLSHGFEGQTVTLNSGRVVLFDSDGSLKSNVDSAAKELGLKYSTTPGHVRFIGEDEYKSVQNQYRTSQGQPTQEIYHRYAAALQEAQTANAKLAETLTELQEADSGDGHWVTINGHPVFIGGVSDASLQAGIHKIADFSWDSKHNFIANLHTDTNVLHSDLRVASSYFDRLTQDQLVKAHAFFQADTGFTVGASKILPIMVSRMDDAHAEQALKQSTGEFKNATEKAIALYGPAKAAEPIIAANPDKYPVFSGDTAIASKELVFSGLSGQAWSDGPQIRVEYAAEKFGPNKDSSGLLNYWAEQRGIADTTQPAALTKTLQSVYDKTQEYYASTGTKELNVYRAIQRDPNDPVTPTTIVHKPLEAWTTDRNQAIDIAGPHGIVMQATVKPSAIFWSTDSDPTESKSTPSLLREVTVFGGALKNSRADYAMNIASPEKQKEFKDAVRVKSDAEIEFKNAPAGAYEQAVKEGWVTINGHHVLIGDEEPKLSKEVVRGHNVYTTNIPPRNLKPGQTTHDAKVDANGNYDKETQAHHDAFVADMVDGHQPTEGRKPIMMILGGGPGSGKTTAVADLLPHEEAFVVANVDNAKTAIPENETLKKTDYFNAGARMLKEGQDMNMQAINTATDKHLDVVWDSAGNGVTKEILGNIVDKGYDVRLAFVNLPISMAIARANNRAATSTDPADKDRHINPDRITALHYAAAAKFFELKDMPGVTEAHLYDNRGTIQEGPKEIYHRTGEGETIHDSALYNEYKQKSMQLHEVLQDAILAEDEGQWITKNGIHIMIGADGVITKGPAGLVGKHISAIEHPKLKETIEKLPANVNPDEWKREDFIKTLPDDPEIHKFVKAVDWYTDGHYDTLTNITEQLNKGDEKAALEVAAKGMQDEHASSEDNQRVAKDAFDQAKLLNESVKAYDSKTIHIHRGLGADQRIDELENLKVGSIVDLAGVKSFTSDRAVAVEFAQRHGGYHYMFELEGEAKAVPIASLSQMTREQEFITQGKFSVESVETPSGATKIFHIKQQAIF
jgi:predicted ABC-type ATPase